MRRKTQEFLGVEDLQQLRDRFAALDPVRQRPAPFPEAFLWCSLFPVAASNDVRTVVLPLPLPGRAPPGCVPSPLGSARCVRDIQITELLCVQDAHDAIAAGTVGVDLDAFRDITRPLLLPHHGGSCSSGDTSCHAVHTCVVDHFAVQQCLPTQEFYWE